MSYRGIAFVAPRKSGKTEAARSLVANCGFTRLGLADAVKDTACAMLNCGFGPYTPFTMDDINDNKAVFRPLLEWVGTTFGRDYLNTPDRWIREFERKCNLISGPVVCDDMRLANEADALRGLGFLIVRIDRDPADRRHSIALAGEDPDADMPSEIEIEAIEEDIAVRNDGSLDDLLRIVDALGHGVVSQWVNALPGHLEIAG